VKTLLLLAIRGYQASISPMLPATCRFTPSCSEYARHAVERYGAARGSWLALKRIGRCHPFGGSGYDPVPERAGEALLRSDDPRSGGE
jgi:putative membrane protein insertion efficiency factor